MEENEREASSESLIPPLDQTLDEQEEQLLAGWEKDGRPSNPRDGTTPLSRKWYLWTTALGLVLLAVLFTLGTLQEWHYSVAGSNDHAIQTNDYILDVNWDYDAPRQRREYWWKVADAMHSPDGVLRPMILVNNQFPGPLIEVNEGDTIVVHVNNQAENATSIHWHGIYQNGTAHMDGTVGITQCPIPPGGDFTYEFTVAGQSGTYWWHAHYGVQSSDGLHGPLVIHGREEKALQQIKYQTDRVILVSDHYHDLSSALLWQYLKSDMENAEPVPNSALLNGRGQADCENFSQRLCNTSASHVGEPTFDLRSGQNHRLRFINVGAFAEFQVQIDEHELAVTEVDGTDVVPVNYHRINISPAQRYSVIISLKAESTDPVWLRAKMVTKCFTNPPHNLNAEVRGIVRTSHNSEQLPTSLDWEETIDVQCKDLNSTDLTPVEKIAAPAKADAFFYLRANFEIGAYRLSRGFFNRTSWRPNIHSPSLLRAMDGLQSENVSFSASAATEPNTDTAFVNDAAFDPSRELVVQTTGIQVLDILIHNFDDGNHPLHLHGYKYFVLAQGHGYPPLAHVGADILPQNLGPLYSNLDLSNPLRRDTASMDGYGWILLRLVADNPGAWAFHCHLSWHTEAGLLMQFLTRTDELATQHIPIEHIDMCSAEGIEKGMGPDDSVYMHRPD